MTDNVVRREVQRRDDPFGIPACFYWTIDEVADWVESIGYGKYKENFRSHFINGRKLLTVDACVLPKMGITHFGDILTLTKLVRDQLRIKKNIKDYSPSNLRKFYISQRHPCGKLHPCCSYNQRVLDTERIIEARLTYFRKRNMYYSGWTLQDWWDEKLRKEEKRMREENRAGDGDTRLFSIGESMQDRLAEASRREITWKEKKPSWSSKKALKQKRALLSQLNPAFANQLNTRIIGHMNWTPVKFAQTSPDPPAEGDKKEVKKSNQCKDPYLPIVFHWKKMEPTKGYPPRFEKEYKCGYYYPEDQ